MVRTRKNEETKWYALMNDNGMFLLGYNEGFDFTELTMSVSDEQWGSSPNLRNERAKDIYLIPAQKKLGGIIVEFRKKDMIPDSIER